MHVATTEEFPYTFTELFQCYKCDFVAQYRNDQFVWLIRANLVPGVLATHDLWLEENDVRYWRIVLLPGLADELAELAAAEEIGHITMRLEGFPTLDCRAQYDGLASWRMFRADINSLVSDPIVHQRLIDFGFDLECTYRYELEQFREWWPGYVESLPSDIPRLTLCHTLVLCASRLLELPEPYGTEIVELARAESPKITAQALALADWIASCDTSTPGAYREVVRQLLERLDLQSFFKFRKGV